MWREGLGRRLVLLLSSEGRSWSRREVDQIVLILANEYIIAFRPIYVGDVAFLSCHEIYPLLCNRRRTCMRETTVSSSSSTPDFARADLDRLSSISV